MSSYSSGSTPSGNGRSYGVSKPKLGGPNLILNLKSSVLPEKIKCKLCSGIRKQDFYSEKQLNELKWKIHHGTKPDFKQGLIKCKGCTGLQPNEMLCSVCAKIKKFPEFSKSQRHQPDKARCKECVQIHVTTEHGLDVDPVDSADEMPPDPEQTLAKIKSQGYLFAFTTTNKGEPELEKAAKEVSNDVKAIDQLLGEVRLADDVFSKKNESRPSEGKNKENAEAIKCPLKDDGYDDAYSSEDEKWMVQESKYSKTAWARPKKVTRDDVEKLPSFSTSDYGFFGDDEGEDEYD